MLIRKKWGWWIALGMLMLAALSGCGGGRPASTASSTRTSTLTTPPAGAAEGCAAANGGHGSLGLCLPKPRIGAFSVPAPSLAGYPTYPDRSNNDPCYCGVAIRATGGVGLIAKANQGTGFVDATAVPMVQSARAAGLAVGLYDFDWDYTIAEAQVFVERARAAGILPDTPNTFPLYLDVEAGSFSYPGLLAQIHYLRSLGYRVGIYTGDWYWTPHAGCAWPQGITAWLSGYPTAVIPCGLGHSSLYVAHQFTSTPIDVSAFLGSLSEFHVFVHATPAAQSANLRVFVERPFRDGRLKVSEREAVRAWFARACKRTATRGRCRHLRLELLWLRDRIDFVAHHPLAHGHATYGLFARGVRRYRLNRIVG